MTKQIVNIGDTGQQLVDKLSSNFTELYNDKHSHNNKTTLDKFGEDDNGQPTFNNEPIKGERGDDGNDATINGQNVIEIIDSDTVTVEILDEKMKFNATVPLSSIDLMFFILENGNFVASHTSPTEPQIILPTTYFPADSGVWHDIITFTIATDLQGTELEFIPGNSFTAKFWVTSDIARNNAQFRLRTIDIQTDTTLAVGTVSVDLGTTGIPSPVLITGLYEQPAVVPSENIRMVLQVLSPIFGIQVGLISNPPNEISYIARLISGQAIPGPQGEPGKNATINGLNIFEIVDSNTVIVKIKDNKMEFHSTETFIYRCTGSGDNIAIQKILSDFFDGTAMKMSLVVIGAYGFTNQADLNSTFIYLTNANTRGAVAYIDFMHMADINITTANRNFLYTGGGVKLIINNLNAAVVGQTFEGTENSHVIFNNCALTTKGTVNATTHFARAARILDSCRAEFNSCVLESASTVSTLYTAISSTAGRGDCVLNSCVVKSTGSHYAVTSGEGSLIRAVNSIIKSNHRTVALNGGEISLVNSLIETSSAGATHGAVYIGSAGEKFTAIGCRFNSKGNGINAPAGTSADISLSDCHIEGAINSILIETADTNASISLDKCNLKGVTNDIRQTSAVNTVDWHITRCRFSKAGASIDGVASTATIQNKLSAKVYMPEFANKFSRNIS